MKSILIIQTAFLGDVILATPIASELKRLYPKADIDFLVKKGNESLLRNNPHLRYIVTFDKSKNKLRTLWRLSKQIRGQEYDLVINLHRYASSGLLTIKSGATKKYGFKKNPLSFFYTKTFNHEIGNGRHEVERNLSVISEFGAKQLVRPELFPSQKDYKAIEAYTNDGYFCLAPASVWYTKQLPQAKWVELAQYLSHIAPVYLLGSPSDMALCETILKESGIKNGKNLAGTLSLLQSAALMSKATRNYVNDSAPLHICSAMNAPVTAFFCSTTPDFGFGPLSKDSIVKQIKDPLYCRPCGLHGHKACPEKHFRCGLEIEI